jgi:multicomponent Na+:H+ antiporter subunit D
MNDILPLVVAVPLGSAAVLAAVGAFVPRRVSELAALLAAMATTALSFVVLAQADGHDVVHWFGGWHPSAGHALGIAFTVNVLDAAIACLVGLLACAALAYSIRYFEDAGHLFQVLILVFLAGMTGFSVTGDLFNLFVFFELMTVSGYALCGYRVERPSVMQGTLNFAVLNSIGAFFVLMGITLLYARTGALNLAQIATALDGRPADATLGIAFALLCVGFLIKAGAVPFHFWLSDAYAVAAAPAGALFAGVMSDLGYHALARIYWTCFAGPLHGHETAIRALLLTVAVTTAVVGAVMCYLQSDIKRQLAYLVVSHGGASLAAVALLDGAGVAASSSYVVTDGLLKGAVFLAVGLTVARLGASNELVLRGRGRGRGGAVAAVLLAGIVGLALTPGFGSWRAFGLLTTAARSHGLLWLPFVLAATTGVTAGTLLRAWGRINLGWGRAADTALAREAADDIGGDTDERRAPSRWLVLAPGALVVVGFAIGLIPTLVTHATAGGTGFVDTKAYVAQVLHGVTGPAAVRHGVGLDAWTWWATATSLVMTGLTAAIGLSGVPHRSHDREAAGRIVRLLHAVHSGAVGDYVVWLTGGAATLCVTLVAIVR